MSSALATLRASSKSLYVRNLSLCPIPSICINRKEAVAPGFALSRKQVTDSILGLPKCKHVFGDKCIKKWFEDSDSCPYCRDKLPSELSTRKSLAFEQLRAMRQSVLARQRANNAAFASRPPFSEESSTARYLNLHPGSLCLRPY